MSTTGGRTNNLYRVKLWDRKTRKVRATKLRSKGVICKVVFEVTVSVRLDADRHKRVPLASQPILIMTESFAEMEPTACLSQRGQRFDGQTPGFELSLRREAKVLLLVTFISPLTVKSSVSDSDDESADCLGCWAQKFISGAASTLQQSNYLLGAIFH